MAKTQRVRQVLNLITLPACIGAAVFLLLWLTSSGIVIDQKEISACRAARICPTAPITQEEFDLAAALLADGEITALFPGPGAANFSAHDLDPARLDPAILQSVGHPAHADSLVFYVYGPDIILSYTAGPERDYGRPYLIYTLIISEDGGVSKTTARSTQTKLIYSVESEDNETFRLTQTHRDLFSFLRG